MKRLRENREGESAERDPFGYWRKNIAQYIDTRGLGPREPFKAVAPAAPAVTSVGELLTSEDLTARNRGSGESAAQKFDTWKNSSGEP